MFRTMFKIWKWMAIGFVSLIILVLIVVWLALNSLVRKTVETAATSSLQTKTTVGSAMLSPLGGSVGLSDVAIASPEGFSSPQIFTLGKVNVSSSIGQLFGTPVTVQHITVAAPQLVIEQSGGKLNIMALKEKLRPGGSTPSDPNAKPMKLVISQLDVTDATVTIVPGIPGVDKTYHVALPAVSLSNVGTGGGEDIGQVLTRLASAIAAKAAESDQVPPSVRQLLALDVDSLKQQLQDKANDELNKVKGKIGLDSLLGEKKKK